jgi:hypothetical protein
MFFLLKDVTAVGRSCSKGHYKAQMRGCAASIVESWRSIVIKSGS